MVPQRVGIWGFHTELSKSEYDFSQCRETKRTYSSLSQWFIFYCILFYMVALAVSGSIWMYWLYLVVSGCISLYLSFSMNHTTLVFFTNQKRFCSDFFPLGLGGLPIAFGIEKNQFLQLMEIDPHTLVEDLYHRHLDLHQGAFFNYVDKILHIIDHLPTPLLTYSFIVHKVKSL